MDCIQRTHKEYLRILTLLDGSQIMADAIWKGTNGKVESLLTEDDLFEAFERANEVERAAEAASTQGIDMKKINPIFVFSYRQQQEITANLLHLIVMNDDFNIKSIEEIKKANKPDNYRQLLTVLAKKYPEHKANYDTLMEEKVLTEFISMVNDQLAAVDPKLVEDEDNEDSKDSNSNFGDSNLEDHTKKASHAAKLMLMFLPSGKRGTALGLPLYTEFTTNQNLVMEALSDIPQRGSARLDIVFERLEGLSRKHNQFVGLVAKLKKLTDNKKTFIKPQLVQFIRTYDKHFENYSTTYVEKIGKNTYKSKIGSSDSNTPTKKTLDLWSNNFENIYFTEDNEGKMIFNTTKANKAVEEFNKLFEIRKKTVEVTPVEINELSNYLSSYLGIDLSEDALNEMILRKDNPLKGYQRLLFDTKKLVEKTSVSTHSLQQLLDVKDFGYTRDKSKIETPITDNSSLLESMATIESSYDELMGGTTVWAGGKMYQKAALYNYLSLIQNDLSLKEASEHLAMLDKDLYTTNSTWKEELLNPTTTMTIELVNGTKMEGGNYNDTKEIARPDELLDRVEKTLRGIYPVLTLADKPRMYQIKGMPYHNITNSNLTDEVVDIFTGYFLDELATMSKAWEELYGENPISDIDKIAYYHSGNVFTSTIFPSLSPDGSLTQTLKEEKDEKKRIEIYQSNDQVGKPFSIAPTTLSFDENDQLVIEEGIVEKLREHVRTLLLEKIKANKEIITASKIIEAKSSSLDIDLQKKFLDNGKYDEAKLLDAVTSSFTINSLIANIEQTKLFTGDPRMYKTLEDFLKRVPSISATGEHLLIDGVNVKEKFNVAVIKGFVKPSDFYTNQGYIDKMMKFSGSEVAIAKSLNLIQNSNGKWVPNPDKKNPYSEVNTTDAQAWISMDRFKEITSGLNGWSPELETAFQNIKNRRGTAEDYAEFTKANAMQPKKGMHFELVKKGGKLVPVYLKYSQAVLFPEIVDSNEELSRMAKLMEEKNISEVVVTDGIKVGAHGVVDLMAEGAKLNPIELSNKYWKLQQDLPTDGTKDKLVLSQPKKNMIADIEPEFEYFPGVKGSDLVQMFHEIDGTLSDLGLKKLRDEIYEDGKPSPKKIREKLIKEFKRDGESKDLILALEGGLSLDAHPAYRRSINSKIGNWYTKEAVKLKQFGGSGIQLSDLGFNTKHKRIDNLTNADRNSIAWLYKNIETLSPPIPESTGPDGSMVFKPGQILLNHSFTKLIPNYDEIKNDPDKLRAAIDPELLRIVASRVPNQKLSFNQSLEIVGFLPPHIGDTVVAYSEMTTQTGSDFDIDKLYYMLPNFDYNPDTQRLEYIKYLDGTSEEATKTRYEVYLKGLEKTKEAKKLIKKIFKELGIEPNANQDYNRVLGLIEQQEINLGPLKDILTEDITASVIREIIEESDLMISLEDFSKRTIPLQNRKKAIENRRIELYRMVLEHPKNFVRIISTVDSDWLKDFINDIIPPTEIGDLDLYDGIFQMDKRREFLASKGGVGQTANHVGDHSLSQDAELYMNVELAIGNATAYDKLDLSKIYSKAFETYDAKSSSIVGQEDALITEILSVFMNAFVDAAKDNYIGRANYNSMTNNVAFMMIRGGVSPLFVTALLSQPIIKEYTERLSNNRGFRTQKSSKNQLIAQLAKDFGSPEGLEAPTMNLGRFTTTDLVKNIKSGEANNVTQLEILSIFVNLLEPSAKALRDSVDASKADREGPGAGITDAIIRRQKINAVRIGDMVGNFNQKFFKEDRNGVQQRKMLGAATDNSINAYLKDVGQEFLENTVGFKTILNEIYRRLYNKLPDDLQTANKLGKLIYGTIMHQKSQFALDKEKLSDLMMGSNNLAIRLKNLKAKGYAEDNQLIDYLDRSINPSRKTPSYVFINNGKVLTPKVKDMLTFSWLEMYYSKDKTLREFAKDLAHYSFYSSLFSDSMTSFYRLIPYNISRDLGVSSELSAEINNFFNDGEIGRYEVIIDNVLRNLLTDGTISPRIDRDAIKFGVDIKGFGTLNEANLSNDLYKIIDSKEASGIITSISESSETGENEVSYKPYITVDDVIVRPDNSTFNKAKYYKLIGTVEDAKGNSHPFYVRTNKLGYKRGKYQIYEVDLTTKPTSIVEDNNVNTTDVKRKQLTDFINQHVRTLENTVEHVPTTIEEEIVLESTDLDDLDGDDLAGIKLTESQPSFKDKSLKDEFEIDEDTDNMCNFDTGK